jgi:hypothetical protein
LKFDIRIRGNIPSFLEKPAVKLLLWFRKKCYGFAFRKIKLTQGQYAIVEPADYDELNRTRWYAVKAGETFYAVRSIYIDSPTLEIPNRKKRTTVKMHRQIMRPGAELVVDHINHDGLDNRRENLQNVTQRQNCQNRRDTKNRGRSKYIGVQRCEYHKKWRVRIYINGKKVHIGYFDSEIEAAKAYDKAVKIYRGKLTALNFTTENTEESETKTPQHLSAMPRTGKVEDLGNRFISQNLFR